AGHAQRGARRVRAEDRGVRRLRRGPGDRRDRAHRLRPAGRRTAAYRAAARSAVAAGGRVLPPVPGRLPGTLVAPGRGTPARAILDACTLCRGCKRPRSHHGSPATPATTAQTGQTGPPAHPSPPPGTGTHPPAAENPKVE